MKKILIAVLCVFALCFTSCASKQAPETEPQVESPVPENTETEQETENTQNEESEETAQEETAEEIVSEEETSEDFPEPEDFEEPEIITLEPEEEQITEEPSVSEEVEKEEPPVIETTDEPEVSIPETDESTEASDVTAAEDEVSDVSDAESVTSDSDTDEVTSVEGGIDITDDDSASAEEYNENSDDVKIKVITPSRSVTLKKFEYLDITYPGTGWIYMGLTDNSKDLAYFGRKLGTKDTKFTLQARNAGTKIVHFYKNDPLTGRYLDDYLEIVILPENGSNKTHVEAPQYKLPVQKKEIPVPEPEATEESETQATEETPAAAQNAATKQAAQDITPKSQTPAATKPAATEKKPQTALPAQTSQTTQPAEPQPVVPQPSTPAVSDSTVLLQEAQVLYNEKEYAAALAKINLFFEFAEDKRDEGLYLKGQILEAKSEVRDIKGAIDSYTSLTKNYPASKLWDNANKRIIYLKRFYLEVR